MAFGILNSSGVETPASTTPTSRRWRLLQACFHLQALWGPATGSLPAEALRFVESPGE